MQALHACTRSSRQHPDWHGSLPSGSHSQHEALAFLADSDAPTFQQAISSSDAPQWRAAMAEEMAALTSYNTFTLVDLPAGKKALPSRWVLTIKRDATGEILRYKARCVAKGFAQVPGVDFTEVYAPTLSQSTLRTLLSFAAAHDYEIEQLDVKTAFLNGDLDEEIYLQPPPGLSTAGKVLRLHRALYGLRQAPRAWHKRLSTALQERGFLPTILDASMYQIAPEGNMATFLLVHVDDVVILAPDGLQAKLAKQAIMVPFDARDLGPLQHFCGITFVRDRAARTITVLQSHYIANLVDRFGIAKARSASTPLPPGLKLEKADPGLVDETLPFPELVGALNWLSLSSRPDISFSVSLLARHLKAPAKEHWAAGMHVLRYLKSTSDKGLTLGRKPGGSLQLHAFADADLGGDVSTGKSTTGVVVFFGLGPVSWFSRRQECALSPLGRLSTLLLLLRLGSCRA